MDVQKIIEDKNLEIVILTCTPLMMATCCNNTDDMKKLIDSGANVNGVNEQGQTPLIMAIMYKRIEAIKLLLENGADANKEDNSGCTPLGYAICSLEMVKLLVEIGKANVTKLTTEGYEKNSYLEILIKDFPYEKVGEIFMGLYNKEKRMPNDL